MKRGGSNFLDVNSGHPTNKRSVATVVQRLRGFVFRFVIPASLFACRTILQCRSVESRIRAGQRRPLQTLRLRLTVGLSRNSVGRTEDRRLTRKNIGPRTRIGHEVARICLSGNDCRHAQRGRRIPPDRIIGTKNAHRQKMVRVVLRS